MLLLINLLYIYFVISLYQTTLREVLFYFILIRHFFLYIRKIFFFFFYFLPPIKIINKSVMLCSTWRHRSKFKVSIKSNLIYCWRYTHWLIQHKVKEKNKLIKSSAPCRWDHGLWIQELPERAGSIFTWQPRLMT